MTMTSSAPLEKQCSESRIRVVPRRGRIWDRADVEDIVESALRSAVDRLVTKDGLQTIVAELDSKFECRFGEIERQLAVLMERCCVEVALPADHIDIGIFILL